MMQLKILKIRVMLNSQLQVHIMLNVHRTKRTKLKYVTNGNKQMCMYVQDSAVKLHTSDQHTTDVSYIRPTISPEFPKYSDFLGRFSGYVEFFNKTSDFL